MKTVLQTLYSVIQRLSLVRWKNFRLDVSSEYVKLEELDDSEEGGVEVGIIKYE